MKHQIPVDGARRTASQALKKGVVSKSGIRGKRVQGVHDIGRTGRHAKVRYVPELAIPSLSRHASATGIVGCRLCGGGEAILNSYCLNFSLYGLEKSHRGE